MDPEVRIQQFRQMADADPDNELGHFSLGKAFLDADRFADATRPLRRVLELKPSFSKAYHLLGVALDKSGNRKDAVETVTKGVAVADEHGDRVPRDAMADLLREWGAPVPTFKESAATSGMTATAGGTSDNSASVGGFSCTRCGRPGGKLPKPPFKGTLGEKIQDHICESCWREWIPMGTKVINELGLVLASQQGQDSYDQYMIEFLQLEEVV